MTLKNGRLLGIIPARGGSKRLPDKNIKPLCGKPLLAWSIESALDSEYVDEVMVSTDSEIYAKIAKRYGAKVPFIRPPELSEDTTSTFEVLEHCIKFYKHHLKREFEYVALLQPTSPFRQVWHINQAYEKLRLTQADSIISVCPCEHPPFWSNTLPQDESMNAFLSPEIRNIRSQDLPIYYRLNGVLFIAKTHTFLESRSFFTPHTLAYKMDNVYSSDIDSVLDFEFAEFLASRFKDSTHRPTGGGAKVEFRPTASTLYFSKRVSANVA